MPLTNHFEAEPLIIQRIKDKAIAGVKTVASASILAGAQDVAQYVPAIFVLPDAGDYIPQVSDGQVQTETQHWQIIVVVKNIRDPLDVNTTAREAGGYMTELLQALVGWKPAQNLHAMAISARPAPFYQPGYGEFPIILNTRFVVSGDQT